MTIEHEIRSLTSMQARHVAGALSGQEELLSTSVVALRDGLFLVRWQEADESTVVHVEDFANGTVLSCVTTADGQFLQFEGPMMLAQ